jgi:hypothetical protein
VARLVVLGSAAEAEEYGWLRFDEPRYKPEFGCTCTFARIDDETSVTFTMIDHYRDTLLAFADALGRLRPQWEESLAWESEDSDIRLEIDSAAPNAYVRCVMRWAPEWEERDLGSIKVDRAALAPFAEALRVFVTGR